MFELTYHDQDVLEELKLDKKAYQNGIYDFTFEKRFLIYHAAQRNGIDYIAIDLTTGLGSQIVTKGVGQVYCKETYQKLIPMLLDSIKYTGDMRYMKMFREQPMGVIDTIFRVVLQNNGYAIREQQIELSKKMFLGLTQKQVSLCEAEVGTGKTLAYLVAAVVARYYYADKYCLGQPVTITTSSIELQKALVDREIPKLSQMLLSYNMIDKPLTATLRKGKEHYFCLARYRDYLNNVQKYPEKYRDTLVELEEVGRQGLGYDLDRYKISGEIKGRICVKGSCKHCKCRANCRYFAMSKMYDTMSRLDFQVTNHNMYLMSRKKQEDNTGVLLQDSSFVIVDEAHKFRDAAMDVFEEAVTERAVAQYVNAIKHLCAKKNNAQHYKEYIDSLLEDNQALFNGLRNQHEAFDEDERDVIALTPAQNERLKRMRHCIDTIERMREGSNRGVVVTGQALRAAITAIRRVDHNTLWLETDENGVLSLCCAPRDIDNILRERVWQRNASHVLTSGTISDGTDFEFFKKENGLDQIAQNLLLESQTRSPFDYKHHARLYLPQGMLWPGEDTEMYIDSVANKIMDIIHATHGHTAILFTSYRTLNLVYNKLEKRLSQYEVFRMSRSNKTAIADFKKAKNGVLFASGAMWEGVDCVGDCLSSVIIVKLPFPLRSTELERKKEEYDNIPQFIAEHCTPQMLIKLRQGVGRLIRSETDTGVVSILDPRATSMAYTEKVEQALGHIPRADTLRDVLEFMREVKPKEYFEIK